MGIRKTRRQDQTRELSSSFLARVSS
jgi:hypothetical protein